MKTLFPGYYRPSEVELRGMMQSATFVLDSSALLNLYRYPRQARADFLNVLDQVASRLWIPHQVALEFQENRLPIIADQVARFKEVRDLIAAAETSLRSDIDKLQLNKRHSSIDPDSFLKALSELVNNFMKSLDKLEKMQPDVFHDDKLRGTIDHLFEGKIGPPPPDQRWLDSLYSEGHERYKCRIPPGYMDVDKSDESHIYMGLAIKRQYGDLILWKQMMETCKSRGIKAIIFVTDDDKEDWWWLVASKGKKTIGPRPELIEEMKQELGEDTLFYMYKPERFMGLASEQLGIKISEGSVEQVRDIARVYSQRASATLLGLEEAVRVWLKQRFATVETSQNFPDVVAIDESGQSHGFEITYVRTLAVLPMMLGKLRSLAQRHPELIDLESFTIVFVTSRTARNMFGAFYRNVRDLRCRSNGVALLDSWTKAIRPYSSPSLPFSCKSEPSSPAGGGRVGVMF